MSGSASRSAGISRRRAAVLALLTEVQAEAPLDAIAPHWQYLEPGPHHGVPGTALDTLGLLAVGADHGDIGDALDRAAGCGIVRHH